MLQSLHQRSRAAVAEQETGRLIAEGVCLGPRFSVEQQHAADGGLMAVRIRHREPINETGAAQIHVVSGGVPTEAQSVLQQDRRRGHAVIGRLTDEDQDVDRGPIDHHLLQEMFGCVVTKI